MVLEKYLFNKRPKLKITNFKKSKFSWISIVFKFIANVCNVYIPALAFIILFLTFVIQIFFRYFLNHPLTWTYEVTVVAYTWVAILAAGYARRLNEHVTFGVVYDKLNEKGKTIFRILGNILIASTYLILIYPAYRDISFLSFKSTSVLKMPMDIVFYPFVVFLAFCIIYSLVDIYKDFCSLIRRS
jgi:TRAP-type C4-dicarboxylate transport system permease small subunit